MHYTSSPGFNSQWRPNIFNSVLFKKACERERIHLKMFNYYFNTIILLLFLVNCFVIIIIIIIITARAASTTTASVVLV